MSIKVHCRNCGKSMQTKDSNAGKRALCPFCNSELIVPNIADPKLVDKAPTSKSPLNSTFRDNSPTKESASVETNRHEARDSQASQQNTNDGDHRTRSCPYCSEQILASAKKCKHCGEFLMPSETASSDALPRNAFGFGFKFAFGFLLAAGLVALGYYALVGVTNIPTMIAQEKASLDESLALTRSNQMKAVLVALLNYHDKNKHLPPPAIYSNDGKPLLSWRVALLPYMEEEDLYRRFHTNEPWDSPNNIALVKEMPATFDLEFRMSELADNGKTTMVLPVGRETAYCDKIGIAFGRGIPDSTSNTVALVEVNPSRAVTWTKPDDWQVDINSPMIGVERKDRSYFLAGFADAHLEEIPVSISPNVWKAFLTRAGRDN